MCSAGRSTDVQKVKKNLLTLSYIVQADIIRRPFNSLHFLGWTLTVSFIAMTFIPRSMDHIMFVDGLAYAAISRNMAEGIGTFWAPHFADSFWLNYNNLCPFFCEHPPLLFGMQSLLFRVLGDTPAVENIYNGLVLITGIIFIVLIWKMLFRHDAQLGRQAWLPVLLWYGLRIVWWTVPNNMLDTTMAVFCLASCHFQFLAHVRERNATLYWILAGVMIFLACMVKGPVGLFPLAFPIWYFIVYKGRPGAALKGLMIMTVIVAVAVGVLLMHPPANLLLTSYFKGQVLMALLQKRERAADDFTAHFYLIKILFKNIIPHLLLVAGLVIFMSVKKIRIHVSSCAKQSVQLNLILIISIIFPMLISVKQSDPYLMPLTPFVALFFASMMIEWIISIHIKAKLYQEITLMIASAALVGIMGYQLNNPETDRLHEVSIDIAKHVPAGAKIFLPSEIALSPLVHTAFQRYARLSIASDSTETPYRYYDDRREVAVSMAQSPAYEVVLLAQNAAIVIKSGQDDLTASSSRSSRRGRRAICPCWQGLL